MLLSLFAIDLTNVPIAFLQMYNDQSGNLPKCESKESNEAKRLSANSSLS